MTREMDEYIDSKMDAGSSAAERERPFVCNVCTKGFLRMEHLQRHQRIHTGEKPFGCGVCEKRFGRNDELLRHMRLHQKKGKAEKAAVKRSSTRSATPVTPLHQQQHQQEQVEQQYTPGSFLSTYQYDVVASPPSTTSSHHRFAPFNITHPDNCTCSQCHIMPRPEYSLHRTTVPSHPHHNLEDSSFGIAATSMAPFFSAGLVNPRPEYSLLRNPHPDYLKQQQQQFNEAAAQMLAAASQLSPLVKPQPDTTSLMPPPATATPETFRTHQRKMSVLDALFLLQQQPETPPKDSQTSPSQSNSTMTTASSTTTSATSIPLAKLLASPQPTTTTATSLSILPPSSPLTYNNHHILLSPVTQHHQHNFRKMSLSNIISRRASLAFGGGVSTSSSAVSVDSIDSMTLAAAAGFTTCDELLLGSPTIPVPAVQQQQQRKMSRVVQLQSEWFVGAAEEAVVRDEVV